MTEFGEREVELLIFALNHGNVRIRLYDTPGSDNFISVEYNSKRNMKYVTDFLITFEDELKAKMNNIGPVAAGQELVDTDTVELRRGNYILLDNDLAIYTSGKVKDVVEKKKL